MDRSDEQRVDSGGELSRPRNAPTVRSDTFAAMEILARAYAHPDVGGLVARLQREYVGIYGSPDESPLDVTEFGPPRGAFAVGYEGGEPVAMGGWRLREDGRAEVKRMYVVDERRGNGLSRAVLSWLEESATTAGARTLVLETNQRHPAALALYRASGYTEVPPFGYYADQPLSVYLGRELGS